MRSVLVGLGLLVLVVGCVSSQGPTGGGRVVVRPVESEAVLINPGMGFTTFQRFNGDRGAGSPDCIDEWDVPDYDFDGSLANEDHPATSLAYFRILWRYIEPVQGQYRWDYIDALLATARQRGQTLMLRIAPTEGFLGREGMVDAPDWYRALVGQQKTPTEWWVVDHNDE